MGGGWNASTSQVGLSNVYIRQVDRIRSRSF